jgi:DNA polymerase-3 subunit beta
MKFSIARADLEKAIQRVLAVVSPKTTLPVLANFLVQADEKAGAVSLTATDLDMTVTTSVSAEVAKGGGVTLPAKRFAEIVRELGTADVEFAADAEEISIHSGKSKFRIVGIPTEEFPSLPRSDRASAFSVESAQFVRMVEKVGSCTSDSMGMTATDGHRLATFKTKGKFKALAGKTMIVPPKALGHAVRIVSSEGEGTVEVSVHENHVAFFIGETTINSRLLEGPFPNYRQVIPKDNDKELIVAREELAKSVRRVAVLADALTHQVRLTLSKKKVELVVSTPDVGEAREEIPAKFGGDSMEVGYNANYLLDVLKHMDGEDVRFLLGTVVGAAVINAMDQTEDEEYMCLLMPLRLTS